MIVFCNDEVIAAVLPLAAFTPKASTEPSFSFITCPSTSVQLNTVIQGIKAKTDTGGGGPGEASLAEPQVQRRGLR